ncbi:hypothetical protein [Halobacillus litoralis]|uniref:Uncharacterized protein n=1 Tax=Halobacillus litoralis TaxID=45668 RepID=A0A410MDZ9_9BACI|nr:hypothetical protein [Halobacillus litoralis]QAS52951.1 hypothetical protein HLI_12480 [Halobacillus litoralis]
MVQRKLLTALITFIISVAFYSVYLKGPAPILFVAIFCGTLLSITVGYIEKKIKFHSFPLGLILHSIIAFLLTATFLKEHYFQVTFYFALPVAVGYFLIDEVLRAKLSSKAP